MEGRRDGPLLPQARGLTLRLVGTSIALGLLVIGMGGAITSVFVLGTLSNFKSDFSAFLEQTQAGTAGTTLLEGLEFMSLAVTAGSIATITTLILVGLFFLWFTRTKVTTPLGDLTDGIDAIAHGEIEKDIPYLHRRDEMGIMARAVQVLKENTRAKMQLEKDRERDKQQAEQARQQVTEGLLARLDAKVMGLVNGLSAAAEELENHAKKMQDVSRLSKRMTEDMTNQSKESSGVVDRVAGAAAELSLSIEAINGSATNANEVALEARGVIHESHGVVEGLSKAVESIGSVVSLIREIAEQTNLLALNATIEAARAGEAGRGFTVVANEIKTLANNTATATDDITRQITEIRRVTESMINTMNRVETMVNEIGESIGSIAGAVGQQNAATREIASNAKEASSGTQLMVASLGNVTRAAESTGEAAEQVLSSASHVAHQASDLRQEVDQFLHGVRMA